MSRVWLLTGQCGSPAARARLVLVLGLGLLALAPAASTSAATRWYVAFGGSLAAGAKSGGGQAYVPRLYGRLSGSEPELLLHNVACRGTTTTSARAAGTCPGVGGSQLGNAEAFLVANRSRIAVVTVDVGADDVYRCVGRRGVNARCVRRGLRAIDRNLPSILTRLRAAAGPQARIAGMTKRARRAGGALPDCRPPLRS